MGFNFRWAPKFDHSWIPIDSATHDALVAKLVYSTWSAPPLARGLQIRVVECRPRVSKQCPGEEGSFVCEPLAFVGGWGWWTTIIYINYVPCFDCYHGPLVEWVGMCVCVCTYHSPPTTIWQRGREKLKRKVRSIPSIPCQILWFCCCLAKQDTTPGEIMRPNPRGSV